MNLLTRLSLYGLLALTGAAGLSRAVAQPQPEPAAVVAPVQDGIQEVQMKLVTPPTSPAVKKVFKRTFEGVFWYEVEDEAGNRHYLHVITTGSPHNRGVAYFGSPSRAHFVRFY
jgi:hypothetical protein